MEEQPQHKNGPASPTVRIKRLHPAARIPLCATEGASGLDLFACITEGEGRIVLQDKPKLVGTGIAMEVPRGYDAQVRPRSGLSAKGVMVAFGTVDSDYRGEVMVTMYVLGESNSFEIRHGDRIAQLVIARLASLPMVVADELTPSKRGARGHGSTGIG